MSRISISVQTESRLVVSSDLGGGRGREYGYANGRTMRVLLINGIGFLQGTKRF